MCKFSLILFFSVSLLSLFSTFADCEENCTAVELRLDEDDLDVQKILLDGWNKLVAEGKNRGAMRLGSDDLIGALVQVIDNERRYTILTQYWTEEVKPVLSCYIFVYTKKSDSLLVDCFRGFRDEELKDPEDRAQYEMYHFLCKNMNFVC